MSKMRSIIIAIAILVALTVGVGSAFSAANQADCEALAAYVSSLTDEALNQPITNVTAVWKPATVTPPVPEYCEVKGRIFPETDFAVRLPTAWQGRSIHNGGGGWDGSVASNPSGTTLANVLTLGYAFSASNGGHSGAQDPGGRFGLKDPYYRQFFPLLDRDNPYACQKIVDFGNRALREVPVLARKIYKQYYGTLPHHSYYNGTSTGGREGFVEAQENYDIFDGLYVGYPTGGHVAVCTRGLWDSIQGEVFTNNHTVPAGPRELFAGKAIALRNAVYGKCDGVDGLVDGVIDDPRKCNFDHLTDLPACPGDVDAPGCFTLAQRQALKEIYRGAHNSSGQLYIGTPLSAEYLTNPTNPNTSGFGAALLDGLMGDLFRYIVFDPPIGPTWDMMTFNWETDLSVVEESTCTQCYGSSCKTYQLTDELDAVTLSYPVAPNMGGFAPLKAKGGKIIQWHGWSDALVSSLTSVSLYETVMGEMGIDETKSFWKLYMVPGMGHGTPGIGWPQAWNDGFGALVNWVETGVAPSALPGTRAPNAAWGWPATTRPLCPYPEAARYSGTGSIYDAANFMCVPPIEVRIEPETLNLRSKGEFTAFITVPEGYNIIDWNIANLTCEGAPAVKGAISGNTYIVKFKRQDLQGIETGEEVTLTVKGTFTHDGKPAQIQASDTVRVIK